jgi:hypothetical protein
MAYLGEITGSFPGIFPTMPRRYKLFPLSEENRFSGSSKRKRRRHPSKREPEVALDTLVTNEL